MLPQIQIKRINHVTVTTRRLEESLAFYKDVLGCKQIARPNFSFGGAWLYAGEIQIHLVIEDEVAPHPGGVINTRDRHVAFEVEDVDAMEGVLRARGVKYQRKLIADRGIHQLFFHDPD